MNIETKGILIKAYEFNESSAIVSVFTEDFGIVKGFLKSKKSLKNEAFGNIVYINKKQRLSDQLGFIVIEPIKNIASLIAFDQFKLTCLNSVVALIDMVLQESQPYNVLYFRVMEFLEMIVTEDDKLKILSEYSRLELEFLKSIGFGLDLSKCVATNTVDDLVYISPKSGGAVSRIAGEKYKHKLFKIPIFWTQQNTTANDNDLNEALKIFEHFFEREVLSPMNYKMPFTRNSLKNWV